VSVGVVQIAAVVPKTDAGRWLADFGEPYPNDEENPNEAGDAGRGDG
jgi:hypothetical protein